MFLGKPQLERLFYTFQVKHSVCKAFSRSCSSEPYRFSLSSPHNIKRNLSAPLSASQNTTKYTSHHLHSRNTISLFFPALTNSEHVPLLFTRIIVPTHSAFFIQSPRYDNVSSILVTHYSKQICSYIVVYSITSVRSVLVGRVIFYFV